MERSMSPAIMECRERCISRYRKSATGCPK